MLGWYLVYCKGKKEKAVREHLEVRQLGCFLPEAEVASIKRGKRTVETVPLFPNYLFVRFDPYQTPLRTVLGIPGISSIVKTNGQVLPVETSIVVGLRQQLARSPKLLCGEPEVGDCVQILEGPFASLQGIFAEPDGDKRSMLLVELLGNQQKVTIDNLAFRRL
ncbi:transcription/translation regulatory transformer protein RfaH [Marinobacter hydrocarbonoclasticus]|nr:transcription/translation regulatory transformer protein RfaH [Marinobacter nauticus]